MIEKYEIVLGMEIHMQLGTEMKMFCSCKSDPFFSDPNTNVCPTCLGLPGAMPQANLNAIHLAQKMAYALGGKLNNEIIFERKNYFYPDLPKAFQLTCPHYPISTGGQIDLSFHGINYPIRWQEIHLEEDTAKSLHSDMTYIDFNKSGVPLLELVTKPDFKSIDDAVTFCKEIQLIARALGISGADMEKGQMRLEANISVRKIGETGLPNYRVELKNINSFGFMKKALEHELRRQVEELEKGNQLFQETRGFDENKKKTFVQRSKEEANDYRYFPEPDIPPIRFTDKELEDITTLISKYKLPNGVRYELSEAGVPHTIIEIMVDEFSKMHQNITTYPKPIKVDTGGRYLVYLALKDEYNIDVRTAALLANSSQYKNMTAEQIAESEKKKQSEKISDTSEIEKIVETVISENQKVVDDYKSGKENALQFLVGQIMKQSCGKADVKIARDILLTKIQS